MLFNTYTFWLFFAVVFVLYRLLPFRAQNYMLLAASYIFYANWNWRYLFIMIFSTTVDFFIAQAISAAERPRRRKALLFTSLTIQLGLLGTFKYYGFFAESFNYVVAQAGLGRLLPVVNFLLPVGISFYIFQTISYTIDVYRRQFKCEKNYVNYALFVSFFPHLVAGPLVRATKLLPQLTTPRVRHADDFREGLYYIITGLFKKVFIGDSLSVLVNAIFQTPVSQLSGMECLVGIYAFAFQIYGDFSGYSSIAQGVAKWLNIDLSLNFRMPYLAVSPSDFWGRWHISLSTWFRDYVYVPLARRGGGRITKWRLYSTQIIVMLLSGLWHGAAWTFVIWGFYHGLLLCGHRLYTEARQAITKRFKTTQTPSTEPGVSLIGHAVNIIVMFHLVCLGWLVFRAESMAQVAGMLGRIAGDFRLTPFALYGFVTIIFYAGPLMAYELWLEHKNDLLGLTKVNWVARGLVYSYCVLMLWFFPPPVSNVFIYFQF